MQVYPSVTHYQNNPVSLHKSNSAPLESDFISPNKPTSTNESTHIASSQTDTVSLSNEAKNLSAASQNASSPTEVTLPVEPTLPSLPNNGEKVENYIHYKKAQVQYQFYSDLAGTATGNGSMSATSAYIIKNNDDARAATVNAAYMNQQQAVLNTYIETTQSINTSV